MTSTTESPVDDFARAVRAALADLPPDEVDDLTDGLEADLAERAADQDSPEFGDAAAYAQELRTAAGLPPRASRSIGAADGGLVGAWLDVVRGLREFAARPLVLRAIEFFVSLRPVWWVIRGCLFYCVVTWVFHGPVLELTPLTFVIGVVTLVASVQFGRGRWLPRPWMRRALLGVNVVLVLCVPIAFLAATEIFGSAVDDAYASGQSVASTPDGLSYEGHPITNIFAYDASGVALTNVQLFDQHGNPLVTVAHPNSTVITDYPDYLVPNGSVIGRPGWNVYPLLRVPQNQVDDNNLPKSTAVPVAVKPKYASVPPLGATAPTVAPTATPTATPVPTAPGSPEPTPTNQ